MGLIFKTTDMGDSWGVVAQNSNALYSVFMNADTVYAVGLESILKSNDAGVTWYKDTLKGLIGMTVYHKGQFWHVGGACNMLLRTYSDVSLPSTVGFKKVNSPNNKVTLFPNPLSRSAKIKFANPDKNNYRLSIYNDQGKLVKYMVDIKEAEVLITNDNMANGIYFYQLTGEDRFFFSGRFIVEDEVMLNSE